MPPRSRRKRTFDAQAYLDSAGVARSEVAYGEADTIYAQGDACTGVMYIRTGEVKLSVLSKTGRETIVAVLGPGSFFGEGALAGQKLRIGRATARAPTTIVIIETAEMQRLLHEQHALSDRFIVHLLARNIRIEEDLIDQLFNPAEKRLARALLLLARYGEPDGPLRAIPKVSQKTLAEMVGTTRSRVNVFMKRFKKLGFVEDDGGDLMIDGSLLGVVLID